MNGKGFQEKNITFYVKLWQFGDGGGGGVGVYTFLHKYKCI